MSNENPVITRHQLPDDVLIDAARMFYPDVPGSYVSCAAALQRMRDRRAPWGRDGTPRGEQLVRWRLTDPVSIAYFAMTFVSPMLGTNPEYHPWHGRLIGLRKEREARFLKSLEGGA